MGPLPEKTMNDVQKINLRQAREWLSGDIALGLPRAWLAAGAAVFVLLVIVAFD